MKPRRRNSDEGNQKEIKKKSKTCSEFDCKRKKQRGKKAIPKSIDLLELKAKYTLS